MKITIIHPSRNRPKQAARTRNKWLENSSLFSDIQYILSVDNNDSELDTYKAMCINGVGISNDNRSAIDAINKAAQKATGDLLVQISDDFDCFPDWDLALIDAVKDKSDFVLKTYDGVQNWIVTLPIMDRVFYEKQGYFYNPDYRHMFADTDLTHFADMQGKLIFRNDITFRHNHYSTGANVKDEVNVKADGTWAQGESVYLERVRNNFGLPKEFDVNNLSELALAHKNWLRNKLR